MKSSVEDPINALVTSAGFAQLERSVTSFNLFRVLRCADYEIRHSNVLGWLMDPSETHGAGDKFLMSFVEETGINVEWPVRSVRVRREWNNIDILVELNTSTEAVVLCIENKIYARQGKNQLARYRREVETLHKRARHVFVFLTLREETPNDPVFAPVNYEQIAAMLRSVLALPISQGPQMLIENYLEVIESKLGERQRSTLVEDLCKQHPRAIERLVDWTVDSEGIAAAPELAGLKLHHSTLEVVLRYRPKRHKEVTALLMQRMEATGPAKGWKLAPSVPRIIRLIPEAWKSLEGRDSLPELFIAIHLAEELPHLRFVASTSAPLVWKERIAQQSIQWDLPGVISEARRTRGMYGFYIEPLPDLREVPSNREAAARIWSAFLAAMARSDINQLVEDVVRVVEEDMG